MALSELSRNRMIPYFSTAELGGEVTSEMLSYFPARDVEEPVTKEFFRSELALTRLELRNETSDLRAELRGETRALGKELRAQMRQQFFWLMSTMLVILGAPATLIVTLH